MPDGVSVAPTSFIIPPGSNTGQIAVTVDAFTSQGALNVELQGSAAGASATVATNLPLFVRGNPGTLDPTFASNGVYEDPLDYYHILTSSAAVQNDGKILVGAYRTGFPDTSAVIRLKADGSIDPTLSESNIKILQDSLITQSHIRTVAS